MEPECIRSAVNPVCISKTPPANSGGFLVYNYLMVILNDSPKNKDKYIRLIGFFEEILKICNELSIVPIVDGSLAVFAHTKSQNLEINDIDVSVPEDKFPVLIKIFEERKINYKPKEYHVLQVLKEDLKIEFGSQEYWLKNLPLDLETLQIGEIAVKVLSLDSLTRLYELAMRDRAKKLNPSDDVKYLRLKSKLDLLRQHTG